MRVDSYLFIVFLQVLQVMEVISHASAKCGAGPIFGAGPKKTFFRFSHSNLLHFEILKVIIMSTFLLMPA